jgi:hypothetical protein
MSTNRKLPPNAGKGRVKGVPNKATAVGREAYRNLMDWAAPKMQGWLEAVASKDPGQALDICAKLSEYCIPKLSRTEMTTGDSTLKIEIIDPTRRDHPSAQ